MNESENKVNLAEIARLHGVNDRLRAEIERWRAKAFNPATLTDEEREAVSVARDAYADDDGNAECEEIAAVLSRLLERTK